MEEVTVTLRQMYFKSMPVALGHAVYLGQVLLSYGIGWSAPVIPKLKDKQQTPLPYVITDQDASWIGSLVCIGSVSGPYIGGFLANAKGRKSCFLLGATTCFVGFFVLIRSFSLPMIYAGRIIMGLGTGIIFINNLVYIGEIASTNIRGTLLTCTATFTNLGFLIAYAVGPYVSYSVTGYIGLALASVFTIGIFFIPETPLRYNDAAKTTLVQLGRGEEIEIVLSAKLNFSSENTKIHQFTEIFTTKSNRRAMFIVLTLNVLQQMSGVFVVVIFTINIFEMAESSIDPAVATIVVGVTQLVASTVTPLFVETSGRKPLLLASTAICSLSMGILGTYFYLVHTVIVIVKTIRWLPLVSLLIYVLSHVFGFGIMPGTFAGEMFSPNVRSIGSAISVTAGWLIGFIASSTFGVMVANGPHIAFWIYASACALAFVFTAIFVPETKGKSLFEVQEMLSMSWIK